VSSRDRLARMDVDTGWAYQEKFRKLQRENPDRWPIYAAAYFALLGEAWATGDRRTTLEGAWVPALRAEPAEVIEALRSARLIDPAGRIPASSWREWYGPVAARLVQKSAAGKLGAEARWGPNAGANGGAIGGAIGGGNAPHPLIRSNPLPSRARARPTEPRAPATDPTPAEAKAAWEGLRQHFGKPSKPAEDPV
jgi:hypothetical protein